MESLIWILIFAIFIATIVGLLGRFVRMRNSSGPKSTDPPELQLRFHMLFVAMFAFQILGAVSIIMITLFLGMGAGGLDILEYDPPGLIETCMILPLALPLTLISYISFINLKERQLATALLISTAVVNVVLAIQLARYWYFHIR